MAEAKRDENGRILKGSTANPNGRPKRPSFREWVDSEHEELRTLWVEQLEKKLREGDSRVIVWFGDQYNGRAAQPIVGKDMGPILVQFVEDEVE